MNCSESPSNSPVPAIETTPTALKLLPKNLLISPWSAETSSPSKSTLETSDTDLVSGLQLTTQSGVTIVITDPVEAEHLILIPLRTRLLTLTREININSKSKKNLAEVKQLRNMVSMAFEEHMKCFGHIPDSEANHSKFYVDYLCEGTEDPEERIQLLNILKKTQDQTQDQIGYLGTHSEQNILTPVNFKVSPWTPINGSIRPVPVIRLCKEHHLAYDRHGEKPLSASEKNTLFGSDKGTTQQSTSVNVQKPMKSPMMDDYVLNIRYKTQPCRNFAKFGGFCPVGNSCHFAHGAGELRNPQDHPKFRTKLCRHFVEKGTCAFGDQCFFLHTAMSYSSSESNNSRLLSKQLGSETKYATVSHGIPSTLEDYGTHSDKRDV
ncbi:unnamed protein product [Echinostoma caproni]|uniref:Zinc finger protein n=1 Tax=Echinostoma caproni TaxID=27848 RepID=A0A183AJJ4_9TREM|nr:unnamed protein product [Echinostoma caproni]